MTSVSDLPQIADLRAALDGRVILPDDGEYDRARTVFSGAVDRRPAAIARPRNAAEVARAVSIAKDAGFELAVRSGGHSSLGHGVVDGGLVIDMREMKAFDIDLEAKTVWAETGLTAGEFSTAAAAHALAAGFGDAGTVGIGGITLGGGVGFLSRLHGLTVDNVLALEIVTADGEVLQVDAESHPDLFWALRGGGGNFGVVTRIRYQLHELGAIVGGTLVLPATPEVVEGFITAADEAPDELSTIANVMPAPPMPFVPEELHGTPVVLAMLCFAGPADEAERILAPFRALAEPIADMLQPMPYPEIFGPEQEDYRPMAVFENMYLGSVDRDDAETIIDYLESSDAPMRVVQLRVLGGAIARVPVDATAYAHRHSAVMANVVSFYEGPDAKPRRQAWVEELAGKLRQDDGGAYVNFLGEADETRLRSAYPGATWDRLADVKRRYDPGNLFQHNHNIKPAAA